MLQNRKIVFPAYLVAFAFGVIPLIDATMQAVPFRFGDARWRWGIFGLLSNAMMIPMIGLLIAFVVADMFEHRTFLRVLGVICAVVAVCALGGLGMFGLDALQLHKDVRPAAAMAFDVACLTATMKSLIGILTLAGFSIAAFTGTKRRAEKMTAKNNIMIGSTRPPKGAAGPSGAVITAQPVDIE
jgi:hypothetical protein